MFVLNPEIFPLYSIKSPSLNPWFTKFTVLFPVEIPVGFTNNCLFVYPSPLSITFTSSKVFRSPTLKLWLPKPKLELKFILFEDAR